MAVPGTTRPSKEQGRDGRSNAESGATLFPVPALAPFWARFATHGKIPALQPTLPNGFDSWAQVFTDWRVSRAFEASPRPRCLVDQPELAAPFVAEIGRAIRDKQLRCRPVELAIHREAVVEPAYERSGGTAYVVLRQAMESAQENYVAQLRGNIADGESTGHTVLRTEVERLQSAFFASRQRHEPVVAQARLASVQGYWAKNQPRGMDDTFFADAPTDSAPVRMSRIDPGWWWRSFFTHLQQEFAKHHSADGCFLDALPTLRAQATKKTLAALIAEWSEARADAWGWDGPGHYRMLANRAEPKAKTLAGWFNQRAPGYLHDEKTRRSLHTRLTEFLTRQDPWAKLLASERNYLSAHWRN